MNVLDDVGQTLVAEGANIMVNRVDRHLRFSSEEVLSGDFLPQCISITKYVGK